MNPLKEYAYLGAIFLLLCGVITVSVYVHRCHADHEKLQSIYDQSKRELKDARDQINTLTTQHTEELARQKEVSDAKLQTAALQHSADLDRLRQLDADRAKRAALAGASTGSSTGPASGCGQNEAESRLKSLEQLAAEQADANRDALVAIEILETERDSLVGK